MPELIHGCVIMRLTSKFLLLILLFLYCSSEPKLDIYQPHDVLTDVFEFELSFGAEGIKDEYLLAQPKDIAVNINGDIYVADEERIKVFYPDGSEKTIIGGPGEGPGEFEGISKIAINEEGALIVVDRFGLSFFDRDHKFIEKKRLQGRPVFEDYLDSVGIYQTYPIKDIIHLKDNDNIIYIGGNIPINGKNYVLPCDLLVKYNGNSFSNIVKYTPGGTKNLIKMASTFFYDSQRDIYTQKDIYGYAYLLNIFNFVLLPERRIAYSHSIFDVQIDQDTYKYMINILDLDNNQKSTIYHTFTPIEIQKMINDGKYEKNIIEYLINAVAKTSKFFPPLISISCDKDRIFAVRDMGLVLFFKKGESIDSLVDIFDANTGKYIKSAYFPFFDSDFMPAVIKNERAYRLFVNKEGFYEIQKYKIDQAVYGK